MKIALIMKGVVKRLVDTDFTLEEYPWPKTKVDVTDIDPLPEIGDSYADGSFGTAPVAYMVYTAVEWVQRLSNTTEGFALQKARGRNTDASARVDLFMTLCLVDGIDFTIAGNRRLLDALSPDTLTLPQVLSLRGGTS